MELRIPVAELSRALSMMQGIVQRKNTMPILANVLLEVTTHGDGAGRLTITATDLDVAMRTERACEALATGSVTVPARALADMVRVLPGPDVTLKRFANNHVEVKSGRTKAKLMGLSAEEYPTLPSYDEVNFLELDAREFLGMVDKTLYAASSDESRYNLNGVLFEPDQTRTGGLSMVATDGHRLVRVGRVFEGVDFGGAKSVILPRKGIGELKRLFDGVEDSSPLEIGFFDNHAVLRRGGTTLGMRLIDGSFPDYKQVIPKLADKVVRVSRAETTDSLKRVSVLASDKAAPVKLSLGRDTLTVSCSNPDAGEVSDDVPVEYGGDEIDVAFNARYLVDALACLEDQNVLLKLTDNLSPGLLVGVDDTDHLCVVMPMRL
ncbi:MAG: DNA polymerase III subunit beta [Myxococcota bacterium]